MTVQSLKTISQSNLDLEHTQALKIGGGHLENKIKSCPPWPWNEHRKPEYDILNHFAVMRKSKKWGKKKGENKLDFLYSRCGKTWLARLMLLPKCCMDLRLRSSWGRIGLTCRWLTDLDLATGASGATPMGLRKLLPFWRGVRPNSVLLLRKFWIKPELLKPLKYKFSILLCNFIYISYNIFMLLWCDHKILYIKYNFLSNKSIMSIVSLQLFFTIFFTIKTFIFVFKIWFNS